MAWSLDDYVDVAERIRQFMQKYPEGSLQSMRDPYLLEANDKTFVVYCAGAYRTPDDPRPGVGWAWEPVPGPTAYTRDSELQNAETSAWGRAIVAVGFETKHIASMQEVRNRQPEPRTVPAPRAPSGGMIPLSGRMIPPKCECGEPMILKNGVKNGEAWRAWMCVNRKCEPTFLKTRVPVGVPAEGAPEDFE